ncbi:MAG: hypothetical protein ACJ76F_00445 [Bacteroidia bacterium]
MKTSKAYIFTVLLLSAIFVISCKKEKKSDVFPEISFYAPAGGSVFNMFDSIYVSAYVSDGSGLESVTVGLTTLSGVPVQQNAVYHPTGTSLEIGFKYELYEYRLTSGYYSLLITAGNGSNTSLKQQVIYINASPVIKKGYYLFSDNGSLTTFTKFDTAFANPGIKTISGKYTGSAISSYNQRLYVAGGAYQNFQAYDVGTGTVKWNIQNLGGGSPYFSSCEGDGMNVILGYNNGQLKRYNQDGTTITNMVYPNNDYYCEYGAVQASNYVAYMQSRSSSNKKLVVFNAYGAAAMESPITFKPLGIFERSTTDAYVVGNDNSNQAQLTIFNVNAGGLQSPLNLPSGSLLSACKVDSNTLLIGHSDGNIYKYQYSSNNLIAIQSGITANRMKYDSGENLVYISSAKQFNAYALGSFSLSPVKTFTHSDTIRDFHVIYNK